MSSEGDKNPIHRSDPLIRAIANAAGYYLPRDLQVTFNQLEYLNLRKSNARLAHLLPDAGKKDWYAHFSATVKEVRRGLAACHYHVEIVSKLENDLTEVVRAHLPHLQLKLGEGLACGQYDRITFEYHAHILTIKRTLDYFAGSVGCYFKIECASIRELRKTISNMPLNGAKDRIIARLSKLAEMLPDTFSRERRSKRDLLAHYKNIEPGVLNISRTMDGRYFLGFAGGGEELTGSSRFITEQEIASGRPLPLTLAPKLAAQAAEVARAILGSYWDMGLLEFPKVTGGPSSSKYAEI